MRWASEKLSKETLFPWTTVPINTGITNINNENEIPKDKIVGILTLLQLSFIKPIWSANSLDIEPEKEDIASDIKTEDVSSKNGSKDFKSKSK